MRTAAPLLLAFLLLSAGPVVSVSDTLMDRSCRDSQERPAGWLDRSHAFVSRKLCEPAAWFDGFFANERADEETPVYTYFRWRNEVSWSQRDDLQFRSRVYATVRLPRASKRLRLLIARDEDLQRETSTSTATTLREPNITTTQLGLRYILSSTKSSQLNIDGGLHAKIPLSPFLKARYRYTLPLTKETRARLTQTLFWEDDDGFGTQSRLDWEWLPTQKSLLRLTGSGTYSEVSNGVNWSSSLTWFRQLNDEKAVRVETGAFGNTRPRFQEEESYLSTAYRSRFLRPWLYYEIQPAYAWVNEDGHHQGDWRLTLMLELQFESKTGLAGLVRP